MMSTQSAIAVKDHVDSYVAGDPSQSDRHVKALVSAIANRIVTIQDLVEVLEPFLTSDIDTHRSRAGYLLNELLSSPCVSLGAEEVHLFVVFFCHRMKDHASTHISLQAIRSLVVTYGDRFDPSYCDFSFIVGELKHSFQAINHPQPVRMALYGLVVELLRKCFENHVLIHFEDTMGMVISQLEGEKDPRCLLLAFQAIDQLAEQAAKSKEPHDDELGEQVISLLSMYFPIMEFPSYNGDGISVSAEILDALLCRLLCSHSMWAARSLAVFIENMAQSNELISRKKSIECAVAIIQKFGLKTIKSAAFSDNSHLSNLRYLSDFLLEVCFSEGSQELLKCTLSLIEAINFSICTISDFNEGDWNDFQGRFMTDIFREVTSAADSLRSRTAWKVCVSLARSGGCVGTNRILAIVVPFLHQKLQAIWASIQENAVKDPFVSLSHISSAGNVLEMCESLISATVPRDLDSTYYWDCTVAHQLWSTNVLISQFFALVSPTSSPAPSMQGEIVRAIIAALKASKALIKVVGRIDVLDFDTLDTKKYVQTVLDLSLKQPFFEDECSSKAVETEVLGLWQALGAVPALSSVLYPAIHDQFLAHAATMNDREIRIVASLLSGSLRESLSKKIVETIVELLRSEVHAGSDVGSLLQIVVEVLKSETPQRREAVVIMFECDEFNALVFSKIPKKLVECDQPQLCAAFQQFSKFFLESASPSIRNTAFALLYDCLKGNFHKRSAFEMFAVSLPVLDSSCAFFQDESNVEVMLHLLSIAASEAAMPLCMGVYINKVSDSLANRTMQVIIEKLHAPDIAANQNLYEVFLFSLKGLLMRSRPHPLQLTVIDLVGDIVCGADFAREAGAMKSTVMAEHIDILLDSSRLPSPSPSALWRQKLFARLFPRIIKKIEESSQSDSPLASNIAPLIVFCKFLGALDPSITFSAPKSAVDVLVRVMDIITVDRSASPQLQYWALTATLVACGSQPEVVQLIAAHLNTLVRCLEAMSIGAAAARSRGLALRCMETLPTIIPFPTLFPFRKRVIKCLAVVLDDRKKSVRQLAARVRNQWMLLQ